MNYNLILRKAIMRTFFSLLIIALSVPFVCAENAHGQALKENNIYYSIKNKHIADVFSDLNKQTGFNFFYDESVIEELNTITIDVKNSSIDVVLSELAKKTGLSFKKIDNTISVSRKTNTPVNLIQQQDKRITGIVTDEKGEPIIGANVVEKGTTNGTITDLDGNFSFEISGSVPLIISYIGYKEKEVALENQTIFNIKLIEDLQALEEVVVIGYGTVKKSDLTGSVSSIKGTDINSYPSPNVMQALSGKSTGVQVNQTTGAPGAGISIRIRGTNSIQGNNEPLYVIDGFPISGNPTNLNNADIESLEILKDASATAIYGSRGANGVVMITTKKGQSGKTRIEFESSYGTQSLIKKLDLMNANEYASFYNIQQKKDSGKEFFTQEQIDNFGKGFDWQDLIFRTAPILTTGLTVSGGTDKTQFSIAAHLYNQDGIVKGSDYNRYSLRTNINHKFNKQFSINLTSTLSRLETERKDSGGGNRGSSMISAAISAPPTLSPYKEDEGYTILSTAYPFVATDIINPMNFINEQKNSIKANVVLANVALNYNPIPELTIKIAGGIENRDDTENAYKTRNYIYSNGAASYKASQATSLLNENTISYYKTFNEKHNVSAVAGFTYQDFTSTYVSGGGSGFLSDIFEEYNLGAAMTPNVPSSGYSKSVLFSYLARANYSFDNKYLFTVSIRRDGSSKYSKGNKWGNFPSAAFAWRISEEGFLKDNALISNLKLRLSWGKTGSQAINAYATLNTLSAGRTIFDDAYHNTFAPGTRLPGNLKWETTVQTDLGFDLSLLNNRINFNVDYYVKNTKDLLNTVKLPTSMGYNNTIRNVGEIQNRGLEIGLNTPIFTGDFKWDITANVSINRNKVVKLYGGEDILGGNINVVVINDNSNILKEGRPVGQFWGYIEDGYDDQGRIVFKDLDQNNAITQDDKTYIGNPNPDFIYGISSSMKYKDFEFSFFLQGVQGNDLLNVSSINNTIDYGFGLNMPKEVYYNHWSPENQNAKYPAISYNTTAKLSNRFIEDGSYLRMKNIQLNYSLPVRRWNVKWISDALLYISAQNLFTITKYSWWDPEVNSYGSGNSTSLGIDHNSYPSARSFTIGAKIGF
ncbi:TonB-dependent receptor [Massilibacteroides vaginae]|uniref:TonB-dependent receptor n=1 Tax=Massilibacteroides vaginae TaxID=1673718 RepID=UPI001C3876D2|nr:TonB-dependent receptor [Massilibacteroides vaginae]